MQLRPASPHLPKVTYYPAPNQLQQTYCSDRNPTTSLLLTNCTWPAKTQRPHPTYHTKHTYLATYILHTSPTSLHLPSHLRHITYLITRPCIAMSDTLLALLLVSVYVNFFFAIEFVVELSVVVTKLVILRSRPLRSKRIELTCIWPAVYIN